ncbi:MAG: glycosyl hydrolase family 28-related protein [Armatimonadota bacterium]
MRNHQYTPTTAAQLFLLGLFLLLVPQGARATDIPVLTWTVRSDWVNVVTQYGADPTGANDSTTAIQQALDQVSNNGPKSAVYFPAGTYKITSTLTLTSSQGALLVGCGRNTTLQWYGSSGGIMFRSNGNVHARYIGLVWDGRTVAAVGIDHGLYGVPAYFETNITHRHEKFMNFTQADPTIVDANLNKAAGIRVGRQELLGGQAAAEILYQNCFFLSNTTGISFLAQNDLDNTFDGCEFQWNGYGIYDWGGNYYVRNCHFAGSSVVDILQSVSSSCSIRRTTSSSSARFFIKEGPTGAASPMTIQDCRIDDWSNTTSAIELRSPGPNTILDCVFTNPPNTNPPIRLYNPSEWLQPVIISNNESLSTTGLIAPGSYSTITDVGAGNYGGWTTDALQSFLVDTAPVEGQVFDAKAAPFNAYGDGSHDDTVALQNCIAAAKNAGNGAVAYLPVGAYKISSTLTIDGGNYTVCGSGYRTVLRWYGGTSGQMISVVDPQQVRIADFYIQANGGDQATYDGIARIRQTSGGGAASILYDGLTWGGYCLTPRTRTLRGLECVSLPAGAQVRLQQCDGNLDFIDCGRATILGNTHYTGRLIVEGSTYAKTGFLGFLTYFTGGNDCNIFVKDNQDLTIDDYYTETTEHAVSISRDSSGFSTGHVTIQSAKCSTYLGGASDPYVTINNYAGRLYWGRGGFHNEANPHPPNYYFDHYGSQPFDCVVAAAFFYGTTPSLREYGSGMTRHIFNNVWRNWDDSLPPNGGLVTNITNGSTNSLISQALDDSRLLGKTDLDLNHTGGGECIPTAGLTMWLKADTGIILNGSTISDWSDVSGANHHVAQATAAYQPTFVSSSSINSKPAAHFDAVNDYLQGAAALDLRNSAYSIFVVAKPTAGDGGYLTYLASEGLRYQSNNLYYKNGGGLNYTYSTVATLQGVTRTSGGVVTIYENGMQKIAGTLSIGSTSCTNFRIGADGLSGIGAFDGYNGDIAEVLVYNTVLSAADRQTVEAYLRDKYALPVPPTNGLAMWLRADAGVTLNGSTIATWGDVSGAGHSVAQATASYQPTFVSSSMNGKPAAHFDASNDYLQGAAALDLRNSAYSIFVVAKPTAGDGGYLTYLASEGLRYQSNNLFYKNGGGLFYTYSTIATLQEATRTSGGVVTVYENGAQKATGTLSTGSTNCTNFRLGGDGLSGIGGFDGYNGDIAEVIVYNTALSAADRQAAETYLRNKYALY